MNRMTQPITPRRWFPRFSLRAVLACTAVIAAVFGYWTWPWQEVYLDAEFLGTDVDRLVVTKRRTLMGPRTYGPIHGYRNGRLIVEGTYRNGRFEQRSTFSRATGEMVKEHRFGVAADEWEARRYDDAGTLRYEDIQRRAMPANPSAPVHSTYEFDETGKPTKELHKDARGRLQGKFLQNQAFELTEGTYLDDRMVGPWKMTQARPQGTVSLEWLDTQWHGVWKWPATELWDAQSSEYHHGKLIAMDGQPVDESALQEFLQWLDGVVKTKSPVVHPHDIWSIRYCPQGESLAYVDLESGGKFRWVAIGYPRGEVKEVRNAFLRCQIVTRPLIYKSGISWMSGQLLYEAKVRHDLVIEAVEGGLIITPRSEWRANVYDATRIQHVDFSKWPELDTAWQQLVEVSRLDAREVRTGIRKLIEKTPLKIDLSAIDKLSLQKPSIVGLHQPIATRREQLRDYLHCWELCCEQEGETLRILPRRRGTE